MATFTRPDILSENIANKVFDFDTDSFRWALSNTAPVLGSTFLLSNVTQIASGGGYTQVTDGAGGLVPVLSFAPTGQVTTVSGSQVVLTASGPVASFRYLYLIDDTPTSPLNPVVGWIDHGSVVTMAVDDTYTVPSAGYFTIG
jgi:hypothetical protein